MLARDKQFIYFDLSSYLLNREWKYIKTDDSKWAEAKAISATSATEGAFKLYIKHYMYKVRICRYHKEFGIFLTMKIPIWWLRAECKRKFNDVFILILLLLRVKTDLTQWRFDFVKHDSQDV